MLLISAKTGAWPTIKGPQACLRRTFASIVPWPHRQPRLRINRLQVGKRPCRASREMRARKSGDGATEIYVCASSQTISLERAAPERNHLVLHGTEHAPHRRRRLALMQPRQTYFFFLYIERLFHTADLASPVSTRLPARAGALSGHLGRLSGALGF